MKFSVAVFLELLFWVDSNNLFNQNLRCLFGQLFLYFFGARVQIALVNDS
jgi:hypothetical protein